MKVDGNSPDSQQLSLLLKNSDPAFGDALRTAASSVDHFSRAMALCTLRKKAVRAGLLGTDRKEIRIAISGWASLRPFADLLELFVSEICHLNVTLWVGEFNNYRSEILDAQSELYGFAPDLVFLMPSETECRFPGQLGDPVELQSAEVHRTAEEILSLAQTVHSTCGAELILTNFRLPPSMDPGAMRWASLTSDYAFRKAVNTRLGLSSPPGVHICDVEFLANRIGTSRAFDPKTWFESKQPYSAELMIQVAREAAHVIRSIRVGPKKLAILDLDNTVWGGVIGDDGLDGIEIGTTSPIGEAYRAFQIALKRLKERGVLLAVASKNDHERAIEPFVSHPDMVLKLEDFVSFKANWEPKSENIREMATELNLGLDSFVFLDDNPAEIEIVSQFVPEVTGICLGDDPTTFVDKLQDSRLFELRSVTAEDAQRSLQYRQEAQRQVLRSSVTDMRSYLESLEMVAQIRPFSTVDAPRVSQLINKSNQFNLTTRRRSEAEVLEVMNDPSMAHFTLRLSDRFGEHGLVVIVIGKIDAEQLVVDTWLMSCRVLKRQVEEETLNELVQLAKNKGCARIVGNYLKTPKNGMVENLFPTLGFATVEKDAEHGVFELTVSEYTPKPTAIRRI